MTLSLQRLSRGFPRKCMTTQQGDKKYVSYILVFVYTLRKISNWSPYIYASFESKIWLYKIPACINQPRFCRGSAGYFI